MEKDMFLLEQNFLSDYVNGNISIDYVNNKMPEHIKESFNSFCSIHNIPEDLQSIDEFVRNKYNIDNDSDETDSVEFLDYSLQPEDNIPNVFEEWNKDLVKISQLSSSDNAVAVSKWRWKNPQDHDMQKCSLDTDVPFVEVEKWWNTVDWIDSYCEGHFHLCPIEDNIDIFVSQACNSIVLR